MTDEKKAIFKLTFGEWVLLIGGILSVGASHARIGMNTKGIDDNKTYVKEEIQKTRQYSYDKTYEMRQEFRELKASYEADHDSLIGLEADMKHVIREQEKTNKLLEQIIKQR